MRETLTGSLLGHLGGRSVELLDMIIVLIEVFFPYRILVSNLFVNDV
jgi:hypothetical protein